MKALTRKLLALSMAMLIIVQSSYGFCGFYVAKADTTIFNNKSEVILVRDGKHTVITMSNDFKGDVKDFAMVVPVPVVLKESDIKVVDRKVFEALDAYSAPRLVEYYDQNPCQPEYSFDELYTMPTSVAESTSNLRTVTIQEKDFGVKIEARYKIGEYDILLLSAKESTGLKDWLLLSGYKIPATADEVLAPYIKSNMKFFVVKVNAETIAKGKFEYLSPLQISFDHDKFMLPIRLGMANSTGSQDMIVYAFTRTGRVECTNYRTVKMPTDRHIPLFVKNEFGDFYKNLFQKTWKSENRNAVFLEYAWDVTPNWGMKCDPCVGPPPMQQEFADAGVWWANSGGQTFFTRMHVRYEKSRFPSDLTFQVTPNNENYQARYVLTNPATGEFQCEEGQQYLLDLRDKRKLELDEYAALTGKTSPKGQKYLSEYQGKILPEKKNETPIFLKDFFKNNGPRKLIIVLSALMALLIFFRISRSKVETKVA